MQNAHLSQVGVSLLQPRLSMFLTHRSPAVGQALRLGGLS